MVEKNEANINLIMMMLNENIDKQGKKLNRFGSYLVIFFKKKIDDKNRARINYAKRVTFILNLNSDTK